MPASVRENIQYLAENLQILRDKVDSPIYLTNAYRCKAHNATVGGSKNSQHLLGKAADIKSKALSPTEIANTADSLMKNGSFDAGGIGRYNTFTHLDIRGRKARWDNTNK